MLLLSEMKVVFVPNEKIN